MVSTVNIDLSTFASFFIFFSRHKIPFNPIPVFQAPFSNIACCLFSCGSGTLIRKTVSTFRAGQSFGEVSLLFNSTRGASVRAAGDAPVTLLVIDRY
jgi:hypothetical protein